ncbi:hypothetical protein H311_02384 [Anncaliia algerae PRA109]|nr:hypothetical protein H311_02384 [Anncaliia algerae PRA109]
MYLSNKQLNKINIDMAKIHLLMITNDKYHNCMQDFRSFLKNSKHGLCSTCNSRCRLVSTDSWIIIYKLRFCKRRSSILNETIFGKREKNFEDYYIIIKMLFQSVKLKTISSLTNFSNKV